MGAAEVREDHYDQPGHQPGPDDHGSDDHGSDRRGPVLTLAHDAVEVRRNGGLAGLLGAVASAVAIAYLARAVGSHAWLDWTLCLVMGAVALTNLRALLDARTPLLVADQQGIRIRLGRTWSGLPWGALAEVEHRPRRGLLRDGRLVMVVRNPHRLLEELDATSRRTAALTQRLYGAPFAVPLALSTRVTGADGDLTEALTALADGATRIVEVAPEVPLVEPADEVAAPDVEEPAGSDVDAYDGEHIEDDEIGRTWPDPRPALAHVIGLVAARLPGRRTDDDPDDLDEVDELEDVEDEPAAGSAGTDGVSLGPALPLVASETPSPLREPVVARRLEIHRELPLVETPAEPAADDETAVWSDRVRPISRPGDPVQPLVIDDYLVEPADDPVIGPELAAARTRLGLSVDQLADRTRIRPHVIESIEVDDFATCGGDFYARGHLRTLARILGVDVTPLLATYDERYADAPINPRRVFEAELAAGAGSIRGSRGGPNWSVLVAAVMAVVLVWSIARLVMDGPVAVVDKPILSGSGGPNRSAQPDAPAVPVTLQAAGGARVVVRDGAGTVVFAGNLSYGGSKTLKVSPPVRVQSTDGALTVKVDGRDRGALGKPGRPGSGTFVVR